MNQAFYFNDPFQSWYVRDIRTSAACSLVSFTNGIHVLNKLVHNTCTCIISTVIGSIVLLMTFDLTFDPRSSEVTSESSLVSMATTQDRGNHPRTTTPFSDRPVCVCMWVCMWVWVSRCVWAVCVGCVCGRG